MQNDRIPVSIITGFLGAGKTTMLNQLIAQHKDKKFAIIENEFGQIGIDNELVMGASDGIFEMSSGCICCTLNQELGKVLNKLLTGPYDFDHLIIETTGIADPSGVAASFVADYHFQEKFVLDGTICVVDTQNVEEILSEKDDTAPRQIAFADLILLNKTDLVLPEYQQKVAELVKRINPYAAVATAEHARNKEVDFLDLKAYDSADMEKKTALLAHQHNHHHQHIGSHSFTFSEAFHLPNLEHWLSVLLLIQGKGIYRIKGILQVAGQDERIIFQSVKTQFSFTEGRKWGQGEIRESRIVFIGYELNRKILEKNLKACLLTSSLK